MATHQEGIRDDALNDSYGQKKEGFRDVEEHFNN